MLPPPSNIGEGKNKEIKVRGLYSRMYSILLYEYDNVHTAYI